MKVLFAFLFLASIGLNGARDYENSHKCREYILSADRALICGELENPEKAVIVTDKEWMSRFAEVMNTIPFDRGDQVLGVGFTVVRFQKNGVDVLRVAPIPDHYIRASSQKAGADWEVTAAQVKAVADLIAEKDTAHRARPH